MGGTKPAHRQKKNNIQLVAAATGLFAVTDTNSMFNFAATSTTVIALDAATNVHRFDGTTYTATAHGGTNLRGMGASGGDGVAILGITASGTNFRVTTDFGETFGNIAPASTSIVWDMFCFGGYNGASTVCLAFSNVTSTTKAQRSANNCGSFADVTWTTALIMAGGASNGGTGSGTEFLLLGQTGVTRKSTDNAATLTAGNNLPDSSTGGYLMYGGGYFVALAANSANLYYTSSVNSAWSAAVPVPSLIPSTAARGIVYLDGKYWLMDSEKQVWSTSDITASPVQWQLEFQLPISSFTTQQRPFNMVKVGSYYYVAVDCRIYRIAP